MKCIKIKACFYFFQCINVCGIVFKVFGKTSDLILFYKFKVFSENEFFRYEHAYEFKLFSGRLKQF
jgi:hypothetical protein